MSRPFTVAVAVLGMCLISGCVKRFTLRPIGCQIVNSYALQTATYEQYHHATGAYPYAASNGPWLAAFFATAVDLRSISANRGIHHLAFDAFQCPKSAPHEYSFFGGLVFEPTPEELERLRVPEADHAYKVYVPVDLAAAVETSPFLHRPDEKALVVSEIRASGLCVEIAGANMVGFGLKSNTVQLPLVIIEDPLAIKAVVESAQIR